MNYTFIVKNDNKDNLLIKDKIIKKLNILKWKEDFKNPDYVFIIGGDGSLLRNFNYFFNKNENIIFIPIKDSFIGYYYNYEKSDILKLINELQEKKLFFNKEVLLEIKIDNKTYFCLNEIKIINYVFPLKCSIFLNNEFLEKFHGTGLVLSTANGSTGFSRSSNGSIIISNEKLFQLLEISPVNNKKFMTLNTSVILDSSIKVLLTIETNEYEIILDNYKLNKGNKFFKKIEISISKKNLLIAGKKSSINSKIKKLQNLFVKNDT